MRCPDCAKMVSYDTEVEPEVLSDPEVDQDNGTVMLEVRRVLACGDCGQELKEATLEMEGVAEDLVEECHCAADADAARDAGEPEEEWEWEAEVEGVEPTEDYQRTDRRGRPIRNPRYMRRYYGATATVEVKCSRCGAHETLELSEQEQASAFEELV